MRYIKALAPSFDGYRFGRRFLQRVDVACGPCDPNFGGRNQNFFDFEGRCGFSLEARLDHKFALNVAPNQMQNLEYFDAIEEQLEAQMGGT